MNGILCRARDLGIISTSYREEQARLFRDKGWYWKEPGKAYPAEKAHIFEQLVFHALAEGVHRRAESCGTHEPVPAAVPSYPLDGVQ